MNIFHQMVVANYRMQKGDQNPAYAGGTALSEKEKKEIQKMKKLDYQPSRKHPVYYKSYIKKSGPGGIIFDFGPDTGNAIADRTTRLLNEFSDPGQEKNAILQKSQIENAFNKYVELGEYRYDEYRKSLDPNHIDLHKGKGTAQIIEDMAKSGQLDCEDENQKFVVPAGMKGSFNKSEMVLNGQKLVAQSETDAAVIEMAKGMNLPKGNISEMSNTDIDALLNNPVSQG